MRGGIDLRIDVTEAAGLGNEATTTVTVFLPDDAPPDPAVVCFAFPGAGYNRAYFSFDMPGSSGGGQAGFHVDRGWIVVACDHLGVGDSTVPDGSVLTYENVAAANKATVEAVLARLAAGDLAEGFPPVTGATTLGIGQSMGGCFTVVLQGQQHVFDGIAALGFSAIHTVVPSRPGTPSPGWPWIVRGSDPNAPVVTNAAAVAAASVSFASEEDVATATAAAGEHPMTWAYHYDDEPADIVAEDMAAGIDPGAPLPVWRSATIPSCAMYMIAPGTVATEAAAIAVPVLVAVGERDVVPDPWSEPKAYKSSSDVTVFVCARMAHMHNFAGTREQFWRRIHHWGEGVAASR